MDINKKIVVFGTRHLESPYPLFLGQKPEHVEYHRGHCLKTYSTGRLEQALRLGYEVYVVSIRPVFGPQDNWWLRQLPADHVLNSANILQSRDGHQAVTEAHRPWRELYRLLGIMWPHDTSVELDEPGRHLHERCGLANPESLSGFRYEN